MSRFLARALAAIQAEPPAESTTRPAMPAGFGGFGPFGERAGKPKAHPPQASRPGFGSYGGFGERAENENRPLRQFSWPEGIDFHLTRDAARISGLISSGCDWRWCPDGGLEILKDDGRLWALSPTYSRRLQAEHLLPADVLETAP